LLTKIIQQTITNNELIWENRNQLVCITFTEKLNLLYELFVTKSSTSSTIYFIE